MKAQKYQSHENERRTELIATLNDMLRKFSFGGSTVITCGISNLPDETQETIISEIQSFDTFTEKNDPYGEHDFGSLSVQGHDIYFKIDYYDKDRRYHSPDPADAGVTCRVMTIMLASEY